MRNTEHMATAIHYLEAAVRDEHLGEWRYKESLFDETAIYARENGIQSTSFNRGRGKADTVRTFRKRLPGLWASTAAEDGCRDSLGALGLIIEDGGRRGVRLSRGKGGSNATHKRRGTQLTALNEIRNRRAAVSNLVCGTHQERSAILISGIDAPIEL